MDNKPDAFQLFVHKVRTKHIPINIHWDLTYRCDHKCVHCYITERKTDELSLSECEMVLDQLVEAGTFTILFSGGDVFVRPDAIDILAAARARRFDVRLNTHGNHITPEIADRLAEMGLAKVSISVYSDVAADHEAVTLIPGSHQKSVDACRMLVERGIAVSMKTPIMVPNQSSYVGVGPLAKEIGAEWEIDAHIVPDDQSDFGLCDVGVHPTERKLALMHQLEQRGVDVSTWSEFRGAEDTARTCAAGTAFGYISPDGRLYPCLNWRDEIGLLRKTGFEELWHHSPVVEAQREITRGSYLEDCDGCTFHTTCSYCPGISHAEHGKPGRRSEYVCERTHVNNAAMEHMTHVQAQGISVPAPGSTDANQILETSTFAERQWASRQSGVTRAADRIVPRLVQIQEPSPS